MTPLTTKEQLVAASNGLPPETVPIAELGGDVLLRLLSTAEVRTLRELVRRDGEQFAAEVAVRALSDPAGRRIYGDGDVAELATGEIKLKALERIAREAIKRNAIGEAGEEPIEAELDDEAANPTA